MNRRGALLLAFAILAAVHVTLVQHTTVAWNALPKAETPGTSLPAPVLKVLSLEYDGVMSDLLLMKTMVYLGGKMQKGKRFVLTKDEWAWVNELLNAASDLDPYFVDPYYIGNAYLTWDAGMIAEANALLEKGTRARFWDWMLPFYIGFNNFYFLNENEKASTYLFLASQRPDASIFLASLASKLALQENRTDNSILFLEKMLERTEDEAQIEDFKKRIRSLKTRLFVEQAAEAYQKRYHRAAQRLEDLVAKGILRAIPPDPAGGEFYINDKGRVASTVDEIMMPTRHQPKKPAR